MNDLTVILIEVIRFISEFQFNPIARFFVLSMGAFSILGGCFVFYLSFKNKCTVEEVHILLKDTPFPKFLIGVLLVGCLGALAAQIIDYRSDLFSSTDTGSVKSILRQRTNEIEKPHSFTSNANGTGFSKGANVSKIIATYNSNEARFHSEYKDLVLGSVGNIISIKTDSLGSTFFVTLDVNESFVICTTKDRTKAANLDRGQRIKFQGTIDDVVHNGKALYVTDCNVDSVIRAANPQDQSVVDENTYRNQEPIICKTDKQIIIIDETKPYVDRYRTWNFPKTIEDIPSVSLVKSNSVKLDGTGVCRHRVANFKTGNVKYEFYELGCYGEATPPPNTVGQIVVYIDNVEKTRKWCVKNGT